MKYQILNATVLKIVACVFMIIDHFAVVAYSFNHGAIIGMNYDTYIVLRSFGRIAFPVFAYLIIDGMIHTKNQRKYLYRLFVLAFAVSAFEILFTGGYSGNPITCLFLGALTIYFFNKHSYEKIFALLPLCYILLSFFNLIPMKVSYVIFGYFLMIMYYFSYLIAKRIRGKGIDDIYLINYRNILSAISICLMCLFFLLMSRFSGIEYFINQRLQVYAVFSLVFILLYNGRRGYNATWFKYFWYSFYPLHIGLLYAGFFIYNQFLTLF